LKKGYTIGYGYDILKSLKIGYYILKISCSKKGWEISFLEIFGYKIGYKYPLIYILPVSGGQLQTFAGWLRLNLWVT
jgi:hypothetical protein